jgi:RimJ/RimL family protein N-acetyltransferase
VTAQVTLRPVTEDDLPFLARLRNDPAAAGQYGWFGWRDPGRDPRRWAESGLLGDSGGTLIVLLDDDCAGSVSWRKVPAGPIASCWNIGITLAPEFRGRGCGSAAQRLLARYLFAHTLAYRVEASTETSNIAEQRALEKAGFTREGVLRGAMFRQGEWHDLVVYSVLRDEVTLDDATPEAGQ